MLYKTFVCISLGLRRYAYGCFFSEVLMSKYKNYFSASEILLWCTSAAMILISFMIFDRHNYMTLGASFLGITSLIFNAKGNPFGLVLMIIFSILYGIISYSFAYYGEMITYLGMTMPMSMIALVSWLRNPYKGNRAEVKINTLCKKEGLILLISTALVTLLFYYILKYFETTNLVISTFSVTTSFIAVYLTFRRSPYFALAYAANDLVLIVLWILACIEEIRYISVTVCFAAFFANDIYGYLSWQKMKKRQEQNA